MTIPISRRTLLQAAAAVPALLPDGAAAAPRIFRGRSEDGWITGKLTGAMATTATFKQFGVGRVFGIPGAQGNELWDAFKTDGVPYLLTTHEASASIMADGYARATGLPGVTCVVPGPGVTNALTGLGEALLDSVPIVCIAGDVGVGRHAMPFQVHALDQVGLLRPVTKGVFVPRCAAEIPSAIHQAFQLATEGEPGPAAVVIPFNFLFETANYRVPPPIVRGSPFDPAAFECAVARLRACRGRIGIYAGQGCQDFAEPLRAVAELLEAPVATSVSGKGVIPETHPLAVGWGFGPHATAAAEKTFREVECLLVVGARFSEVSTGYYSNPRPKMVIQVDANPDNIGRVLKADVAVAADAGVFLHALLDRGDLLRRPCDPKFRGKIQAWKSADQRTHAQVYARCGTDPLALIRVLRNCLPPDALVYVDVTLAEHLAAEAFTVCQPRTYFNPVNNQAMGWSIPAAIGGQTACPGRTVVTLTGDGCFLMTAVEISTAARNGLPVKFFVLDDRAYHYMQVLQQAAYKQTTATRLAAIDYGSFAQAMGVGYAEVNAVCPSADEVRAILAYPGPVLVRVMTDYGDRPVRWIDAVRDRFVDGLTPEQKLRFLARLGRRTLSCQPPMND